MAPVAGMGETEKCIQGFDDKTLKEGESLNGSWRNRMEWHELD